MSCSCCRSPAALGPSPSADICPKVSADHTSEPLHAGGYDERYVPALAAVEDRHFWFRSRNSVIRAVAANVEPTLPDRYRVLEIGCGTGNCLRVLESVFRRGVVLGMDSQYRGLAIARRRVSCPLLQGDLRHAPLAPTVRFDVIGLFDVLEHIEDDVGALEAVRARLTAEGTLLLTVPAAPGLWSAFDVAARHCRRYRAEHLEQVLTRAGFRVDYMSAFMSALYPLAWLKRRWNARRTQPAGDPILSDLKIVPGINAGLRALLSVEPRLIAAGYRLKFGTSLVALSRNISRS